MRLHSPLKKALLPAGLLVALSMTACDPYYVSPSPHPGVVYYPYDYDYYYYPTVGVYFQYSTGYYYYRIGNRWERSRRLPPRYHLDPRTRVKIRTTSPRPYTHDRDYHKRYAPSKYYKPRPQLDQRERQLNRRTYEIQHKERQKYMQQHDRRDRQDRDDRKNRR